MSGPSVLGQALAVRRDRLGFLGTLAARGEVAGFRIGCADAVLINEPALADRVLRENAPNYAKGFGLVQASRLLGDGLLTSEGPSWLRQRRRLRRALERRSRPEVVGLVLEEIALGIAALDAAAAAGQPVDVHREMMKWTAGVLARVVLGVRFAPAEREAVVGSIAALAVEAMRALTSLIPTWASSGRSRVRAALADLDAVLEKLLGGEGPEGTRVEDGLFLDLLRRDAEIDEEAKKGELANLLLAGFDTTGTALAWAVFALASQGELQDRLRGELDGEGTGAAAAIFDEALRLYPPVWLITRRARIADVLAGLAIRRGCNVLISPFTIQRSARFWRDPLRFDPDRFADRRRVLPSGFLPFGRGPRACPGRSLATLEGVLVLRELVRRYRLGLAEGTDDGMNPMLTLWPRRPLRIVFTPHGDGRGPVTSRKD